MLLGAQVLIQQHLNQFSLDLSCIRNMLRPFPREPTVKAAPISLARSKEELRNLHTRSSRSRHSWKRAHTQQGSPRIGKSLHV